MNFKQFSTSDNQWHDVPYYQHKTVTDTLTLPAVIYPNDTSITVGIKGQSSQNGTPTPDSPIMPQGTGERTGNLLNVSDFTILANILNYSVELYNDTFPAGRYTLSLYQNDALTSSVRNTLRVYANSTVYYENTGENYHNQSGLHSLTFTINEESVVRLEMWGHTLSNDCAYSNIMLNAGETALPYEPYGYKIPISSGGVTTNIYLGSTQTVRQIKKVVLTGNESGWVMSGTGRFYNLALPDNPKGMSTVVSTHFTPTTNPSSVEIGSIRFAGTVQSPAQPLVFNYDNGAIGLTAFKQWLAAQYSAGTPVTVWYVLATPQTATVNEPLMKIGDYADTLSNATSIPTTEGANSITVDTTVQPSEFTATWTGWHDASVKEYEGGVGNNKFDEQYPDISTTTAYRPIYVGDGTFTMSSTVGREGTSAALYFLAGNVSTGAHNSTNSVYDGQNRTQTAVDGYVTVAYRRIETLSPENYSTMLSKGSTALPYEPYEYGWE